MLTPNDPDVLAALAKGYGLTNRKSEAIELLRKGQGRKARTMRISGISCSTCFERPARIQEGVPKR